MKKLFLTSSGFSPEINQDFFDLVGKKPSEITVAYIPTASDDENDKSYTKKTINNIESLGMKSVAVDLKNENEDSLCDKFRDIDVILVEGGNTFYLLDWARKSGFDKVVRKHLDKGRVYFGISAGSYIACPNIEAATWKHADKNTVNITDLTSMNLVPFIISAHYNKEKYFNAVQDGASSTKPPIVALFDGQAVLVEDDYYKVIGSGERIFLNGFKENRK